MDLRPTKQAVDALFHPAERGDERGLIRPAVVAAIDQTHPFDDRLRKRRRVAVVGVPDRPKRLAQTRGAVRS